MAPIYCCMINCLGNNKESKHRFPNREVSPDLFNTWVKLTGNKRLIKEKADASKICRNCRVCAKHFADYDFTLNRKLKKGVIPSKNLPTVSLDDVTLAQPKNKTAKIVPFSPFEHTETSYIEPQPSTSKETHHFSMPTPKRRLELLLEVGVSKSAELSPKARLLYRKALHLKRKAATSAKLQIFFKNRLKVSESFTNAHMFEKVVSSMDRIRARFFENQLENLNKKPKGKRYSLEDKVLALALYKQSGTAYRFLSKGFSLPSRRTLMKILNRIPICLRLHEEVFSVLKVEVKNFKHPLDKNCILLFDEMSIQCHLQPNMQEDSNPRF
ncbi:uncharacterized protein LOC132695674 [Cylas formicarius]|uniref:uncharacterized protein LOC132695674 n=1 Tax=Cylas formicarius TaxID=197179 RepID=UPI00295845C7|nr:uncharacterized protein LOC132695674 [Cylas formicarius]